MDSKAVETDTNQVTRHEQQQTNLVSHVLQPGDNLALSHCGAAKRQLKRFAESAPARPLPATLFNPAIDKLPGLTSAQA
jgi:hypothetical protein